MPWLLLAQIYSYLVTYVSINKGLYIFEIATEFFSPLDRVNNRGFLIRDISMANTVWRAACCPRPKVWAGLA